MSITASSLEDAFRPLVEEPEPQIATTASPTTKRRHSVDPLLKPIPKVEASASPPLMGAISDKPRYKNQQEIIPSATEPLADRIKDLEDRVTKLENGRSTASILALLGVFLIALGLGIFVYTRTT